MRHTSLIAFCLLGASLISGAAFAQDPITNGFGQTIFFSPSGEPFRAPAGQPYPLVKWFNQADTNKDGKISHDEFVADAMAFFDKLDVNHDNYISSPENTRYENQIAPEIQSIDPRIAQPKQSSRQFDPEMSTGTDPNAGRYRKSIVGASQYSLIDEPQPVRAADANFDFKVSREEWLDTAQQRFTILDRNGDGFITLDELPKTPAQLSAEAPPPGEKGGKGPKKKRSGLF
ncbi:hypothetical protein [Asticcacaulis sp. 201]|uniref:EF-hand domain-containing protein n=1 Tax=Asticcacaulis sp. 201 TaxID=3028787 RepID=UPI002915E25F|nr:hypothetical protein [Asticcacaulis sp. 201]MDV6331816.1 hypothetical protein [Asticcacaulis sp. 201]